MTKEQFKELSHAVAVFVFVFESSAFSSENDVPAVEGKDGKYTVHHVLRAARGMRAFVPQHLVEFEVKKETPDAPDVSVGEVRVDYDSSQNLKGSTQLSFGTFTHAGEYSYVLSEKKTMLWGGAVSCKVQTLGPMEMENSKLSALRLNRTAKSEIRSNSLTLSGRKASCQFP